MAALLRYAQQFARNVLQQPINRSISLSPVSQVIKVQKTVVDGNVIYEGVQVPQVKEDKIVKTEGKACPLCALGIDVKHTDVLILMQFLRPDGCLMPRRITQLCRVQQNRVSKMVAMAQKAGLMPNLAPEYSSKDPKKRWKWKKFNTYYDESTIRAKYT